MSDTEKTFKVHCANCKKPFHVRFPIADPEAEGDGEVKVECMYCSENVMIEIPRQYIEKGTPTYIIDKIQYKDE